jgi:parvulin-like peptidyl-prolyl isomerase
LSTLAKGLTVLAILLAIGVGLVVWKAKVGSHGYSSSAAVTKLSKEDMKLLLPVLTGGGNPMAMKQLAENPEMKQKLVDNIREFFAVASQARKEGLADDPQIKILFDFIRAQIIARNYDEEKNKGDQSAAPFSSVTQENVDAFYQTPGNEQKFNELLNAIVEQSKQEGEDAPEPTEEQKQQLKEQFAKVKIIEKEAATEGAKFGEEFQRKTDLQVKLQQAAFLNQLYAQRVLKDKVKVTDEDVQQYIAAHPELDEKAMRAKAEEVLQRAKSGDDFAALANEYSQDPGNKDMKTGDPQGGLYKDIKPNTNFDKNFEQAALSLQPGQVAENLVETPFGFHIIKLERKGATKNKEGKMEETYDVRHILFSTMYRDPENPFARPMSFTDRVKAILQEEKEQKVLEEIKANNPIVIEDFEIPVPTEEEIKKMQEQMMQQQMPISPEDLDDGHDHEAETKKPEPKKK